MKKRVVIYQDSLLSYSETFIKKQAVALKNWHPILLGNKFTRNGLPLEPLEAHLLIPKNTSPLRRFLYVARRWLNKIDPMGLKTLESLKPDLIHAHFGTSAVDIWPYAQKLNIPMLVTLHGYDINIYKEYWESGKRSKRRRHYPKQLLALANEPSVHFLAVSTAIKKRALDFGIPEHKITVNYIGVDTDDFTPMPTSITQRKNRILYVGRLIEKKGSPYLINAFAKVKEKIPDAELIIVGKGSLEEQLKETIQQLNLSGVVFLGALSNLDVKTQLDNSKVFCLPSITAKNGDAEGLPISILEAQACGVLVVSSSSGGMGDNLINGKTCFTFPEKDTDKLAELLIETLSNTERHQKIIENQRKMIAENFQLKDCAIRLETLYDLYSQKH